MASDSISGRVSTLDIQESLPVKLKRPNKFKKTWKKQRSNSTKLRIKLPPIESYEKELEFPADAPGRVIVRLERLMGTDKIRITDAKYMSTLLERLEKEENEAWLKRTRDRKQAERNRFRQLAVEGLMEPTPDMKDLYNHPVFRVNRILNRLTKLDADATVNPNKRLPSIILVEPFADGSTGRTRYAYDQSFPGLYRDYDYPEEKVEDEESEVETEVDDELDNEGKTKLMAIRFKQDEEDHEEDAEWGGEDYVESLQRSNSLAEAKIRYGIPPGTNVEKKCKPFRSKLVDLVYDENTVKFIDSGTNDMYESAKAILGAYKRESLTADDFIIKLNALL